MYPGHVPFGYRNNKADRTIEIDPVYSPMAIRLMELYATDGYSPAICNKRQASRRSMLFEPLGQEEQSVGHVSRCLAWKLLKVNGRDD